MTQEIKWLHWHTLWSRNEMGCWI